MPRYLSFLSFSSLRHSFSRRGLLIFAGGVVCVYALAVLFYVQSVPDLGLKSVFSTEIKSAPNVFRPDELRPCLPVDEALANAPQRLGDFFGVPAVLDPGDEVSP